MRTLEEELADVKEAIRRELRSPYLTEEFLGRLYEQRDRIEAQIKEKNDDTPKR